MLGKCWVNAGKTINNVGLMLVKQFKKKCWVNVGKCWGHVGLMLVKQ